MGVTEQNDIGARGLGLLADMNHMDAHAAEGQVETLRECVRPSAMVDIAANGVDRRDLGKTRKNVGRADIAGVQNAVDAGKSVEGFRPQQTVGVGDHANLHSPQDSEAARREPLSEYNGRSVGLWRSLVARFLGVEEVPSSNLGSPTI